MNWFKKQMRLVLLLLAIPLLGAKSEDIIGCGGCSGGPPEAVVEEAPTGDIPGGGVAASKSYSIGRAEVGMSTQVLTSTGYVVSGTVGHYLSQGRTLSDRYLVHHPMSRNVITSASAALEESAKGDLRPDPGL